MRKARAFATLAFVGMMTLYGVCTPQKQEGANQAASAASESWQKEFDELCSKTQDAMSFSVEELKALIKRCDALEPQIEKLDETRKKVYLKRLRQCRGLYEYVLESKTKDKK